MAQENNDNNWRIETIAIHTGYNAENKEGDVIQPIHLSTTFERNTDGSLRDFNYTRGSNPNRLAVEKKIAALENASEAITFSSGMAAIHALFENILEPGCHLVIPDDCYHGTRSLLETAFARWQVTYSAVDMTNPETIREAIKSNTKLIWIETPSNPQLKITDIDAVVSIAKEHGILTACDNTFATPLLQRALDMGVDFVMYSSTKFFSGHSDILGGVVVIKEATEVSNRIRTFQVNAGAVPAPFDCWLLNRSLSTFPIRVPIQCNNAMALAGYLTGQPKIKKVFYPGLPDHANHLIAAKQMPGGFGSVLSILIEGDKSDAMAFASKLKIIKHATSLGGVESLIEHRRSVEGVNPVSPDNLLRISVGIEHVDDLINDISQALQ